MRSLTRFYRDRGIRYILDPGQGTPAWSGPELREMMQGSWCFIANDYELEMAYRKTGLDETGLLSLASTLIVTLGAESSRIITREGSRPVAAARPLRVVDPTEAGDAYRAGFLKGLILGFTWEAAAGLGAVMASFAVEQQGTQEHRPALPDIWRRYEENFGSMPGTARAHGPSPVGG